MENEIKKGTRVLAFDHLLFKDDKTTPLSVTMKPGTVICRYGYISCLGHKYPDLVDIRFDHIRFPHLKGEARYISKGHFTKGVKILDEKKN